MKELLRVRDLHVVFKTESGLVQANRGVSLDVSDSETVGIMGESGCGKTVLFLSLLRLQQPGQIVKGSVLFDGRELTMLTEKEMQFIRGRELALIPQDHATALNPSFTIGEQLREALVVRDNGGGLIQGLWGRHKLDKTSATRDIEQVLQSMALGGTAHARMLLKRYPHQLSGGIRQRVLIAMALLARPRMLIADEPTTALDRATRMLTLDVLSSLHGSMAVLIISHDMEAIKRTCDRVAIMYGGRIIELGSTGEVTGSPRHPYTQLLISCQRRRRGAPLSNVPGEMLNLIDFPEGCSFHLGCPKSMPICSIEDPEEYESGGVRVRCHLFSGRKLP